MPIVRSSVPTSATHLELLQQNLDNGKLPRLIMVTAYGRDELKQKAEGVALASILGKPVLPSALLDAVHQAMGWESVIRGGRSVPRLEAQEAIGKLHGARILLVEDNEINQELARELLTGNGIDVELAENGRDALKLLEKQAFDGVLMDIQMPVVDGYTAAREIRRQARFKDLPVIAMTANAMATDREKVLEAGMNDHIAKPIRVGEMLDTLAKWITPAEPATAGEIPEERSAETVDLPKLLGIDTAAGLAATQGNVGLYRRLLGKFRASQADFEKRFRESRESHDPEEMTRIAHTLKGVSGNLGARGVQSAAEVLEVVCKVNGEDIDERLAAVVAELQPVLENLDALDGSPDISAETRLSAIDRRTAVEPLLHELYDLVANDNIDAADTVEKLQQLLKNTDASGHLDKVAKAVNEYEFDVASDALKGLADSFGVDL
jgi:two-component system sensor histidine kinase/response regulator